MREMIFGMVGGLALFLYGMDLLSNGLKSAAGDRLRTMLEKITKWPIVALLTGAGVTCLIQSSSATTVMVVGLINAGLLTLKQALAVILGANIGTTITGWIVAAVAGTKAFKISMYAMPFIAVGFVLSAFARRPRFRTFGQVLLGLGLLLLGLHIMKEGLGDLTDKDASPIAGALRAIGDRPILGVLGGAIFTMIVQSSSASIAMVIVLATNGGFGEDWGDALRIAIPFVLGDNIGTTVTAQLAALRTNIAGKRAAMGHTVFNVIGVALMLPLVYLGIYNRLVELISPVALRAETIGVHIAIAHSAFNVVAAFVVLPFVGLLERLVLKILPTRRGQLEQAPVILERHLLDTPAVALDQARREIVRMSHTAKDAIDLAMTAITHDDQGALNNVARREDAVDEFQNQITRYLVELSQRELQPAMASELPVLLHTVNDIERISDHAVNISEIAQRKMDRRLVFSESAQRELARMRMALTHMFDNVVMAVEMSDPDLAAKALKEEDTINQMQIDYRRSHIDRLSSGKCDIMSGLTFIDYVNNMEKIGDHLANVAQGVLGGLRWDNERAPAGGDSAPREDPPDESSPPPSES